MANNLKKHLRKHLLSPLPCLKFNCSPHDILQLPQWCGGQCGRPRSVHNGFFPSFLASYSFSFTDPYPSVGLPRAAVSQWQRNFFPCLCLQLFPHNIPFHVSPLCPSHMCLLPFLKKILSRGTMYFSGWWQFWYAVGHSSHVRARWTWHRAPGSPPLPKPWQLRLIYFTLCFYKTLCECISIIKSTFNIITALPSICCKLCPSIWTIGLIV